jgi:hypothetical protein
MPCGGDWEEIRLRHPTHPLLTGVIAPFGAGIYPSNERESGGGRDPGCPQRCGSACEWTGTSPHLTFRRAVAGRAAPVDARAAPRPRSGLGSLLGCRPCGALVDYGEHLADRDRCETAEGLAVLLADVPEERLAAALVSLGHEFVDEEAPGA